MISILLLILLLNLTTVRGGNGSTHSLVVLAPAIDEGADVARGSFTPSTPSSFLSREQSSGEPFIKKMRFQVPESARLGSTMRLSCVYELSGASLHAMKLFKDDKEFYRYTPAILEQPIPASEEQRIAFNSPGIKVDLVRSNDQDIWIKVLDKRAAGVYKCQVSIEDTFKSISAEKRMDVIERARTMPTPVAGTGTAATSWLASLSSSSSSSSSSSPSHQQQRHAVQQQQQKNRAQASFMQQQQHPQPTTSGSNSKNSCKIFSVWSVVCTILVIIMISKQQQQQQQQLRPETDCHCGETRSSYNIRRCWRLLWLKMRLRQLEQLQQQR